MRCIALLSLLFVGACTHVAVPRQAPTPLQALGPADLPVVASPAAPTPPALEDAVVGHGDAEHIDRGAARTFAEAEAQGALVKQLRAAILWLEKSDRNLSDTSVVARLLVTYQLRAGACLSTRFTWFPPEALPSGRWRVRVEARVARPSANVVNVVGPGAETGCAGVSL